MINDLGPNVKLCQRQSLDNIFLLNEPLPPWAGLGLAKCPDLPSPTNLVIVVVFILIRLVEELFRACPGRPAVNTCELYLINIKIIKTRLFIRIFYASAIFLQKKKKLDLRKKKIRRGHRMLVPLTSSITCCNNYGIEYESWHHFS